MQTWRLLRNCRLAPRALLAGAAAPTLLSLLLSLPFLAAGYPWIAVLALVQAGAVGVALLHYAVHAIDGEVLTLRDGRLTLTRRCGRRVWRHEWQARTVRVQPPQGPRQPALLLLVGGQSHAVGTQRAVHERARVARELRLALAGQAEGGGDHPP